MARLEHRGHRVDARRLKYQMGRAGLTSVDLAGRSGLSVWVISRALNGHPISPGSLRRIAAVLAEAPVADGDLLAELEDQPAQRAG